MREKTKEAIELFGLLLAVNLGTAVADLAFQTNNPMIIYVWSGLLGPTVWLSITIYMVKTKALKKDRIKAWAVISSGALLICFSNIFSSTKNPINTNVGLILFLAGILIIVFAVVAFRSKKSPEQLVPQFPS